MILHRRAPRAWLVAVDHDAAQVSWRGLHPGRLRIEARSGVAPVAAPVDVLLVPPSAIDDGASATATVRRADAGTITVPGLPAGRLVSLQLSGSALDAPIELAARTLAPLPGEELCRLATVSDLHLGATTFGQRGTIRELERHAQPHPQRCAEGALDEAVGWGAQRVLVKGDITNIGLPAQWRAYAELVERCPVPVDAIAGNHDVGAYGARRALPPADAAAAHGLALAAPLAVRDLPGLRVVLADTTVPGVNRGRLGAVADELVEAVADAPRAGGALVVLHHHLHPARVPEGPPHGIAHREGVALLDRLGAAHPHVLVTSGHTHRHRRWGRAGVTVTQVGATKDFPGVWAGYRVHEGGLAQVVRRIERPDCAGWLERSRLAALGSWEHLGPGRLDARCFDLAWWSADEAATGRRSRS